MRHHTLLLATVLATAPAAAQYKSNYDYHTRAFEHIDVSITAGTTGLGFDVATPITPALRLRGGMTFMPHMDYDVTFAINAGRYDSEGQWHETSMESMQRYINLMHEMTGITVDTEVQMTGTPTMWDAHVLLDVLPFRNKHWHLSAGFYVGSRQVARAVNKTSDMPSLIAVGIYNQMYDHAANGEPVLRYGSGDDAIELYRPDLVNYGRMGFMLGEYTHDVYYTEDVLYTETFMDETGIHYAGDVRIAKGSIRYHAGDPYMMEPDENSMARARVLVNRFRPYIGFGYGGRLLRGSDDYHISFDAGLMMWGGTPQVVTHDGTDLTQDVRNIAGKVGDYVSLIKSAPAYPVLSLRLTRRF